MKLLHRMSMAALLLIVLPARPAETPIRSGRTEMAEIVIPSNAPEPAWQALEAEYRAFFPVTHRAALEGAIDMPPGAADMYYDFFVKNGPEMIKGLMNRASCR